MSTRLRPSVSHVTTGHDVADARLHRQVHALHQAGLTSEVRGLGNAADGPADAVVTTVPRRGFAVRAWRAIAMPWSAHGAVTVAFDPDVTFGCWVRRTTLKIFTRTRAPYIADVHEDYANVLRDRAWARGPSGWAGRVFAAAGAWATRRADAVMVADSHLLPEVPDRLILKNFADSAFLPVPSERDAQPRALYVGDLRRSRGLFSMLDAIEAASAWELDLVGPIAGADLAEARRRLDSPALRERVRWHDRLPPREAWTFAAGAWVGLLMLDDTPAFREAIPSKLYEYLYCGLAVISTPLPRIATYLEESGAGRTVADARAAAVALEKFAADPAGLDELREKARGSVGPGADHHREFVDLCVRLGASPQEDAA